MTQTRWFALAVVVMGVAACDSSESTSTTQQQVFDCNDPAQRLTCAAPDDPDKRFVCHATGSSYVKIAVPLNSPHAPGVAHGANKPADQAPGASGNDVGTNEGLDCECNERICGGTCTGAEAGTSCDDGDKCTGDGACDGDACAPGAPSCTPGAPIDACTVQSGACDGETGACGTSPLPEGTVCGETQVCDGAGNCVDAAQVVINEVESSGGVPGDWVELFNAGTSTANVSGWRFLDNDDTHTAYVIPAGTTIAAGGTIVLDEASFGFGLGGADSARLFRASGALADSFTWTSHATTTYGRCPDGTGAFRATTSSTKNAANDCGTIVINEIESSGGSPGDWVELFNRAPVAIDISGWVFKDNDDTRTYAVPAGTVVAPGAYYLLEEAAFGFGLGSADSARVYDASAVLVDAHSWTAHAATTYARCPNGTGAFATSGSATKGATNDCGGGTQPPPAAPWPGRNAVVTVDAAGTFGGNLSGLFYEPAVGGAPDVLWAVRNGPSTLFRLVWNGSVWVPESGTGWDAGKTLRYPAGTGSPDAEDVTRAELSSTAIYVATERDNDVSGISRNSILRFDLAQPGAELIATHEWNLTGDLPVTGPNLGFEAITWVPDSFLVANSFFDATAGHTYVPAEYPGHGGGLFFVGVEASGMIHAYALNHVSGGFTRIATIASGDSSTKALSFDRDVGYLWTYCGAGCGNQSGILAVDSAPASPTFGRFTLRKQYARPSTMPNLGNEGIAFAPESQCVGGFKTFWWTDDGETGGHSLRADAIPCGAFVP